MDREHNQQEMTGQEIERGSLVHVLLFPSLRVPSAWVPRLLGHLLHRPSAPPRRQDPGLWSLRDSDRPRRNTAKLLRQICRCSRLPLADKAPEREQAGRRRGARSCSQRGGALSALSGAPPLLSRPVLSPAAGSVTPAHIYWSYRHGAPAVRRTWLVQRGGLLDVRVDVC